MSEHGKEAIHSFQVMTRQRFEQHVTMPEGFWVCESVALAFCSAVSFSVFFCPSFCPFFLPVQMYLAMQAISSKRL